jgi:hypothetical protein
MCRGFRWDRGSEASTRRLVVFQENVTFWRFRLFGHEVAGRSNCCFSPPPDCATLDRPVIQQKLEKNKLYYGDNYEVLQRYVREESVDLVYLDPPFNSRQEYSVLFAEKDGSKSSSQIRGPGGLSLPGKHMSVCSKWRNKWKTTRPRLEAKMSFWY